MKLLLVGLVLSIVSASGFTATTCGPGPGGLENCSAGIRSEDFKAQQAQKMALWCWAASISMILEYHGYKISQEQIVVQTFGSVRNAPAWGFQITEQLNRKYKASDGREFTVSAKVFDAIAGKSQISNLELVESLQAERPLLIGTSSHAMVMTAVQYVANRQGRPVQIYGAIIRDPWPGKGEREITDKDEELWPLYAADIQIEAADGNETAAEERIQRCRGICGEQSAQCNEAIEEGVAQCEQVCEAYFCDQCVYAQTRSQERACERRCDACKNGCDRARSRPERDCERRYERCEQACE